MEICTIVNVCGLPYSWKFLLNHFLLVLIFADLQIRKKNYFRKHLIEPKFCTRGRVCIMATLHETEVLRVESCVRGFHMYKETLRVCTCGSVCLWAKKSA